MVVDTTELFDEILERALSSPEFRLVDAAHASRIRMFAADHVSVELPAKIQQKFARRGAAPQVGLRIWEGDYLPYMYFVDTSGLPIQSLELERLQERDPSDVAQAQLTVLLSPVLSLSSDKDLIENGFALKSRGSTARSVRSQMEGEAVYMAVALPGGLAWAGVDSAFRAAGSAWGQAGKLIVAGTTIGGMWLLARAAKNAPPEHRARILGAAEMFMQTFFEATNKQQEAGRQLTQLQLSTPRLEESVVTEIGSLLASASEPMTATQISRELWTEDGSVPRDFFLHVREQLSQLPAFVRVGTHRWQLGRLRAHM